jgi:transcription antitermination factor NusG
MGKITKPVIDLEGLPTEPAWYLVATRYNSEEKYARDLLDGLKASGLSDYIVECFLPIRAEVVETTDKKGKVKTKIVKTKILDNYVYVKAIMNETVWDYLRTRLGASTVLAPGGIPSITPEEDVERMKMLCKSDISLI